MTNSERYTFFSKLFGQIVYAAKTRLPETALSVRLANTMRAHAVEGRYRGVFCHVANEGKRSPRNGWMLKAMGVVSGSADIWFVFRKRDGELGALMCELKTLKNTLSPAQVLFGHWCKQSAIPYVICRSVEDVENALREHGGIYE